MLKKCYSPSCTADPKIGRTGPGASASRLKRRHPLRLAHGVVLRVRRHIFVFTWPFMGQVTFFVESSPSELNSEGERRESAKGPFGPFADQRRMMAGRGWKPRPENISKHVIIMITCFDMFLKYLANIINELEPFHGSSLRLQELSFGSVLGKRCYWSNSIQKYISLAHINL